MPGGAAVVGIAGTDHPEEVARVMDYLVSEEVMAEFYARTLFIPGHLGLAKSGIDFETDNELAADALSVFSAEVPQLHKIAYDLQAYPLNSLVFDAISERLPQVYVGEMSLVEAYERVST